MTKKDFTKMLFEKGIFASKAEAERKFEAILGSIEEVLQSGEELNFIGWGKFEVVEKAARMGRNPKTGEAIQIEAKKAVKFKAGKTLLEKMN
ncbi:DNA-binding protein HU-beta [Fusobacterium sp. DD29]|jgi:DNA-binding protein HU-beta|uniref:HU family DNA-binding protein n=1 Tax=unclassified Fusobacterium TaxID=2648384 RepID=UPI001B8C7728|nr:MULTISPECIES: HU family DNA-binding protein [unclassified Fusobacterium]MBR8702040.1 DNA-binding protein HU-beta [Fusobacterium sp. DD45]MBR8711853.1 DNA-binding protein HU-beta [Fusobacterium sp. DD28]MBR8750306.1 DNA-binding protein HU-beta [Fusobacterium sp. DD29]MBR8752415.1 DNA-binding protein HU-beta [Fusobacterium sp. DD26]MBR8762558.1 DNA-binding protein HU-beta [Fusobacterium sp. DD25]